VPAAPPTAPKEPAADTSESKAPTEAPAVLKGRRTLKIRTAKLYTPSQKAEILEHARARFATGRRLPWWAGAR
jgi:hypothetical protein